MATLIEQVEASMRLCAALERRVAALEKVVGREGRTETEPERPKTARASKVNRRGRRGIVIPSPERVTEIRETIRGALADGPKSIKQLCRATGLSGQRIGNYLQRMRRDGTARSGERGVWVACKIEVAA